MAITFQVDDLVDDAARMANVPAFTTSTNITRGKATYWMAQAARSFSALLKQKLNEDNTYMQSVVLPVAAGLAYADLPEGVGEVKAVLWVRSPSELRLLQSFQQDDLERLKEVYQPWQSSQEPTYRLENERLVFYPGTSTDQEVLVFYETNTTLDTSPGATYLSRLDTDLWLTLTVAVRILLAQGRDTTPLKQELQMLEANLFASDRRRDVNATNTIRDVRGRRMGNRNRDRWGH